MEVIVELSQGMQSLDLRNRFYLINIAAKNTILRMILCLNTSSPKAPTVGENVLECSFIKYKLRFCVHFRLVLKQVIYSYKGIYKIN